MGKYKINPLLSDLFDLVGKCGSNGDGVSGGNTGGDGNIGDNTPRDTASIMDYLHDAHYEADSKQLVITPLEYAASSTDFWHDAEYIAAIHTLNVIPKTWAFCLPTITDFLHSARYVPQDKNLVIEDGVCAETTDSLNDAVYISDRKTLDIISMQWTKI